MEKRYFPIQRILSWHYDINNVKKYKQCLKNNPKTGKSLKITLNDVRRLDVSKVLKKVKLVQKLDLMETQLDKTKLIQLLKNQSRVKEISFPTLYINHLWLKYLKSLRGLTYITFLSKLSLFSQRNYQRKLTHLIKRHKLNSLHVALKECCNCEAKSTLVIEKYPSTLKNLAIDIMSFSSLESSYQEKSLYQAKLCNFGYLKNLTNLSLSLGGGNILWEKCLKSICCVDQLENLELQIGGYVRRVPNIYFSERLLKLKSFSLKLNSLPRGIERLLFDVSKLPLKTFSLDLLNMNKSDFHYFTLGDCFNNFSCLENLTLKFIVDLDFGGSFDFFNRIQTQMSRFNFKKLSLYILLKLSSKSILPSLSGREILKGSTSLEELSIKSAYVNWNHLEILSTCAKFRGTIRKLELSDSEHECRCYTFGKEGTYKVFNLACKTIRTFSKIEVLKLPYFDIDEEIAFEMIIYCVTKLTHLKKIQLGKISPDILKENFEKFKKFPKIEFEFIDTKRMSRIFS